MNGVIYKIVDLRSSKIYLGSSKKFNIRKKFHLGALKKNTHHSPYLQRVYNKYGVDNLQFIIIEDNIPTKKILLEREQYYLDLYKPFGTKGFNTCHIAYSVAGIKHSEESLNKIRAGIKNRIKVLQYSKEGIFIKEWSSISQIGETLNCSKNTVWSSVTYNRLMLDCIWKKYEKDFEFKIPEYTKRKKKIPINVGEWKKKPLTYTINNITKEVKCKADLFKDLELPFTEHQYYYGSDYYDKLYNIQYLK